MRTTLDIDNDVLQAAKERASLKGTTTGVEISLLARQALSGGLMPPHQNRKKSRNGIPLLARRQGKIITLHHVQKIMDEEGV